MVASTKQHRPRAAREPVAAADRVFGIAVNATRKARGRSQRGFDRVSASTLSGWETFQKVPQKGTVWRFLAELEVKPYHFEKLKEVLRQIQASGGEQSHDVAEPTERDLGLSDEEELDRAELELDEISQLTSRARGRLRRARSKATR